MAEAIKYKRATPLIRRIQNRGGSFYTMSSAAEDLNLSIGEDTKSKFRFSKFALLNIPNIKNTALRSQVNIMSLPENSNNLRLDAIPGAYDYMQESLTVDRNVQFAESFQNYCLNLENTILASDGYNSSSYKTVSERVFFKWLKEMGGIRFDSYPVNGLNDTRFIEEADDAVKNYNRVVQYIGDINFVDKYSGNDNTYNSVYVHIPLEVGNFPSVLFKTNSDDNYSPGRSFYRTDVDENSELILGRKVNEEHPDGLSLIAFYDNDSGIDSSSVNENQNGPTLFKKIPNSLNGNKLSLDESESAYKMNDWWYLTGGTTAITDSNTYILEPEDFNDASNDSLAIYDPAVDTTDLETGATRFLRSKLDGIEIDFDANSYSKFFENLGYSTLIDSALQPTSTSFKFNTILLYYDIYENSEVYNSTTGVYDMMEEVKATNLFGVLFVDKFRNEESDGYGISRYEKCRPNDDFKLNGNSYGFRLNFKVNLNNSNVFVDSEFQISDSNTLSMELFHESLTEMARVSTDIYNQSINTLALEQRVREIEEISKMIGVNSVQTLSDKYDALQSFLNQQELSNVLTTREELVNLIQNNYKLLYSILEGKTSLKVAFDLGTINAGQGISLQHEGDNLLIDTYKNEYTYAEKIYVAKTDWSEILDVGTGTKYLSLDHRLQPKKNYLRFDDQTNYTTFVPNYNMKLYLDDSYTKWETGQVMRLYWKTPYDLENINASKTLRIYTDANNTLKNSSSYGALVAQIEAVDFKSRNYCPVIEIQCLDADNFIFVIDFLN